MSVPTQPVSGLLAYLGILRFVGPDSLSFLQGQVSNDTRLLAQGRSLLAAYSSPQGRVLALMRILPHSGGVIAILPRELVVPTMEALRKFVLRAKVKIEDAGDALRIVGVHGAHRLESAGLAAPPSSMAYAEPHDLGVAAVNGDPGRYWVIGSEEKLSQRGLGGGMVSAEQIERDWRLADIRAGLPQIYLATREAFVAQMLNLDLLDGISFTKGCYTGQEIIARTQHRGRIKRRLYRLRLPAGEWQVGQTLRLTDGRSGRVTEAVSVAGGFEALAVLNMEPADGEAEPGAAIAADPLPVPYELQVR
jgi:tRNA-modifying protein YgfZ